MVNPSDELITCINDQGALIVEPSVCKSNLEKCESLAKSMLGCTIHIRGKLFVIRMLEIYYGGLADDSHDWYRTRFMYKTSKYRDHTAIQAEKGLRVYLSSLDPSDRYARFDIVVGPPGVPVSFLIRSVWDENFHIIGAKAGSPNIVLRAMNLLPEDHGATIEVAESTSDATIFLENTHGQVIKDRQLKIKQGRRINLKSDFETKHSAYWNFSLG